MDPVSHVIFARTIVTALDTPDRSRFGRGVRAAAIFGGLSPDADSILMPAGWDVYLRFHEIGTHSLFGAILCGCAAGALIRALVRRSHDRTKADNPAKAGSHGGHLTGLALAGAIGALSHLALDVISGARLGLMWPLANVRSTLPLVAMADPWLIGVLAIGAVALWFDRQNAPRTAVIVLLAVTSFLGVKGLWYVRARQVARVNGRFATGTAHAFEAKWGSWRVWNFFEKDGLALRAWRVNERAGTSELVLSWPMMAESPDVAKSRSLDTVRNFLSVHELAFAVVEHQPMGRRAVLWSDVRFCRQAEPGTAQIDCALWFGGSLDADGEPVMQVVRVGGWTQTRWISE